MRRNLSEVCEDADEMQTPPCKQPRLDSTPMRDDMEDEFVGSVWSVCSATERLLALAKSSGDQGVPIRLMPRLRHAAAQLAEILQGCNDREKSPPQGEAEANDVAQLADQSSDETSVHSTSVLCQRQSSVDSIDNPGDGKAETKKSATSSTGKENTIGRGPVKWSKELHHLQDAPFQELRHSREFISGWLNQLKDLKTEVVRYKDKASSELVHTRVPSGVMALLKMRVKCDGKDVSEERLARMAVQAMAAQAYDPLRAVASLCPASFLPPSVAMNVLGSGCNGWVFFDPDTNTCLKVMLDDNGPHEYEIQHNFAEAGLAPRPISLEGPYDVPNPEYDGVYVMRMEVIDKTLEDILSNRGPCGPYSGLDAPDKDKAESLTRKLVSVLAQLRDRSLVHGDLHMGNIGVKGSGADSSVMVIDFSRSCTPPAPDKALHKTALDDGHAYDIFRLITEMFDSFEALETAYQQYVKDPQKELRALEKKGGGSDLPDIGHEMHQIRQIASLRAYLAEQRNAFERTEQAYNIVLGGIVKYASAKFSWTFDGALSVRNRRLKQSSNKRHQVSEKAYFNSNMYWLGFKYNG